VVKLLKAQLLVLNEMIFINLFMKMMRQSKELSPIHRAQSTRDIRMTVLFMLILLIPLCSKTAELRLRD